MKKIRNSCLLVLTAFIWGIAFVAQSTGGDAIGPFSFNCIRFLMAGFALIPVVYLFNSIHLTKRKEKTNTIKGGIVCGIVLCLASNLQQLGITMGTAAGKAGFLTACYVIIVPLLGLFLHKKCGWNVWVGVLITLIGLYLLCIQTSLQLQQSDILLLLCALMYSVHILVIDHYSSTIDGVCQSCIQFFVAGILSSVPMFLFEIDDSWIIPFYQFKTWIPILYAGICSSGIGYTLQVIGQEDVHPVIASLLMSLESVFSVLAGWVLLHQSLSTKELLGCAFIFLAIVLAQLPLERKTI